MFRRLTSAPLAAAASAARCFSKVSPGADDAKEAPTFTTNSGQQAQVKQSTSTSSSLTKKKTSFSAKADAARLALRSYTPKTKDSKIWGNEEDDKNVGNGYNQQVRKMWNIKNLMINASLPISITAALVGLPYLDLTLWEHFFAASVGIFAGWRTLLITPARNPLRADLTGRNVMVVGTSRLALRTAYDLQQMGGNVRVVGATEYKEASMGYLKKLGYKPLTEENSKASNQIQYIKCDVVDPIAVRLMTDAFRKEVKKLDILINCQHFYPFDGSEAIQPTGEDRTLALNFLGPFHVTERLLESVGAANGRVVNVVSSMHCAPVWHYVARKIAYSKPEQVDNKHDNAARRFGTSMLLSVYHAQSLSQVEGITGCSSNAVNLLLPEDHMPHTSGAKTNFIDYLLQRSAAECSATVVNTAIRPDVINGGYYTNCKLDVAGKDRLTYDDAFAQELMEWAVSRTIRKGSSSKD